MPSTSRAKPSQARQAEGASPGAAKEAMVAEVERVAKSRPDAQKPSDRECGRAHDSVQALTIDEGGIVEHPKFVMSKEANALPHFLINYQHRETCLCTHCFEGFIGVSGDMEKVCIPVKKGTAIKQVKQVIEANADQSVGSIFLGPLQLEEAQVWTLVKVLPLCAAKQALTASFVLKLAPGAINNFFETRKMINCWINDGNERGKRILEGKSTRVPK